MLVLGLLLTLAACFYLSGLYRFLSLEGLQARYSELTSLYERRPGLVIAGFMLVQISALALAIPGAVLTLALAGGALFGPGWGFLIVLGSITIGDSLGFLLSRFLLREWVQRRFGKQIGIVDRGVEQDGAFYLLALRLMAVVPFFVVNVTMALTRMPLRLFAPVSLIGVAPAAALYVNAGTALSEIDSAGDILSPRLILLLTALGLLPIIGRFAFKRLFPKSPQA